jgi:hypothetical protein
VKNPIIILCGVYGTVTLWVGGIALGMRQETNGLWLSLIGVVLVCIALTVGVSKEEKK